MATSRTGKAKGKKVVSQEELRRLMRAKQGETAVQKKRIESPFAKYNSLGHLTCVLCSVHVKSEILWQAHVLGKQHKQKITELKGAKQIPQQTSKGPLLKRKTSDSEKTHLKKIKDTDVDSCSLGVPVDGQKTAGSSRSGLILLGNYDEDDDDSDENNEDDDMDTDEDVKGQINKAARSSAVQKSSELPSPTVAGLPADFFDSGLASGRSISHSGSVLKAGDEPEKPVVRKDNTAEALPEGFFDDPVTDAKVRKVDAPKDQMDKEWDEFQKELRQVNSASEAIVAVDDEEGRLERQIDEIDEQIECYRRVEVLREKRDVVKDLLQKRTEDSEQQEGESSEDDEDELLQLLSRDWRAKGVLS
ncbi:zinc finger protein 830 isoform X2 [Conger conger]|uniref:zinc finger protein 830 isoform X2 n=1 Tax=Conger conger TaxID=82655 RepID=UPI002A5A5B22|nr:zinc finger protein 830 isoform X2 [Conger conger]